MKLGEMDAECLRRLLDLEFLKLIEKLEELHELEAPKPIFTTFNETVGANTNIVAPSGSQRNPLQAVNAPCIFRIYVALDTAGIFSVQRQKGGKTVAENMNQGVALTANAAYMFDLTVDEGEFIDFQTAAAGIVLKLSVVEKDDAK